MSSIKLNKFTGRRPKERWISLKCAVICKITLDRSEGCVKVGVIEGKPNEEKVMDIQEVRLGQLADGRYGLFTNGFLACSLTEKQAKNIDELRLLCQRMNFKLIEEGDKK